MVNQRAEQIQQQLAEYERRLALPVGCPESVVNRATQLCGLAPEELERLSATDCGEAAFVLLQYALYLQRAANTQQSAVRWAEESLRRLVAPQLGSQKGWSFEERKLTAIRGDKLASSCDSLRVKAQLHLDRVNYLANRVDAMARALLSLQASKRGKYE